MQASQQGCCKGDLITNITIPGKKIFVDTFAIPSSPVRSLFRTDTSQSRFSRLSQSLAFFNLFRLRQAGRGAEIDGLFICLDHVHFQTPRTIPFIRYN
jgi:hypothetical protein